MSPESYLTKVLPTKNKLFRFAFRLLGSSEEAKDVVQDVLVKVWSGREGLDEIQNIEAWCMRITRNLSLDRIRSKQRKETGSIEELKDVRQSGFTPDERTEMNENMQQVKKIIESLPEKQRQVIHLRDVEGYSYLEIVEILELDMNQVKINLFRARHAIREKLVKMNAYGL